jgi:hypothetical protein
MQASHMSTTSTVVPSVCKPRPGGLVPETVRHAPETELRTHWHHQHHGSYAAGQLERHETPDPVRSDALDSRFHCVRQQADRHDRYQLDSIVLERHSRQYAWADSYVLHVTAVRQERCLRELTCSARVAVGVVADPSMWWPIRCGGAGSRSMRLFGVGQAGVPAPRAVSRRTREGQGHESPLSP